MSLFPIYSLDEVMRQIASELPDITAHQKSQQWLLLSDHHDVSIINDMSDIWRAIEHDLDIYHYVPDVTLVDSKFILRKNGTGAIQILFC